jgi:hypothetical protein
VHAHSSTNTQLVDGTHFKVANNRPVFLVTAVLSSIDAGGANPLAEATATARALTAADIAVLTTGHIAWCLLHNRLEQRLGLHTDATSSHDCWVEANIRVIQ